MSSNEILTVQALDPIEEKLLARYAEDVAAQSERLDRLAERLITLELAIPSLFVTVFKLVLEDKATFSTGLLVLAFACWLIALLLTLATLWPRTWRVNEHIMEQDARSRFSGQLGIRDYFHQSARYKRWLIFPAIFLIFSGICAAMLAVL